MSQEDVALLLGVEGGSVVSKHEDLLRMPPLETALAYEIVYGTPVRELFAKSGVTKYEIAVALVTSFPELEIRLPPKRRAWMDADERMDLFDALSFAVTALADPESSFPVP